MLMDQISTSIFSGYRDSSESWDTFRLNPIYWGTLFWRLGWGHCFLGGGTEIDEHKMCGFWGSQVIHMCCFCCPQTSVLENAENAEKNAPRTANCKTNLFLPSTPQTSLKLQKLLFLHSVAMTPAHQKSLQAARKKTRETT